MTASEISDLLAHQPWPGFLALMIVALGVVFWAYRAQVNKTQSAQDAHLVTAKELAILATTITQTWQGQQGLFEDLLMKFDQLILETHSARAVQQETLRVSVKAIDLLESKESTG